MLELDDSLRDLYQQLIVDHGRRPRHRQHLKDATISQEGHNPLCGDELTLQLRIVDGIIKKAAFQGQGCAISMASTSLMLDKIQGMSLQEADELFSACHAMFTGNSSAEENAKLGKLAFLSGVSEYPVRVKCATLCWQTLRAILDGGAEQVSTE